MWKTLNTVMPSIITIMGQEKKEQQKKGRVYTTQKFQNQYFKLIDIPKRLSESSQVQGK